MELKMNRWIENFITDTQIIEQINLEYENYITKLMMSNFLLKSKNLKNKIQNDLLFITNKDL